MRENEVMAGLEEAVDYEKRQRGDLVEDVGASTALKAIQSIRKNKDMLYLMDLANHDVNAAWNTADGVKMSNPVQSTGMQFFKALSGLEKLLKSR